MGILMQRVFILWYYQRHTSKWSTFLQNQGKIAFVLALGSTCHVKRNYKMFSRYTGCVTYKILLGRKKQKAGELQDRHSS